MIRTKATCWCVLLMAVGAMVFASHSARRVSSPLGLRSIKSARSSSFHPSVLRSISSRPCNLMGRKTAPTREFRVGADKSIVESLANSLSKSRNALQQQFNLLMTGEVDDDTIDELEEQLLMADVGISTTTVLLDPIRDLVAGGETNAETLRDVLRQNMRDILDNVHVPLKPKEENIWVLLVVGVNGAGKTTTIAKMANRLKNDGRKVMLAAADTFRAAAVDQLGVWADRIGVEMTTPRNDNCKPSTVVYDAIEAAKKGGHDTVIIDTAGRLQNKEGLMDELNKIYKAVQKSIPDGPHETLLVLDGTVGQNSVIQAKEFNEFAPLTGVVVTKLDGSSKGGAIFSIAQDLKLPVRLIGVGEKMEDLRDFDPEAFIEALA